MQSTQQGLEMFLRVVINHGDLEGIIANIQHQQDKNTDTCLNARDIAAHFIVDLYSDQSPDEANINRITTNLENVAEELFRLSRALKELGKS